MYQTLERLRALPTCLHYKGIDCGPMCQCAAVDEAIHQLQGYRSDLIAIGFCTFVAGVMVGSIVTWAMSLN
jgi:hypothetical protein